MRAKEREGGNYINGEERGGGHTVRSAQPAKSEDPTKREARTVSVSAVCSYNSSSCAIVISIVKK